MAEYNVRGNKVANAIYDKFLKPSPQDEAAKGAMPPIPEKPAGIDELPNINMSAAPIKNLSELKTKTPQEQHEHNVQKRIPASAYARKEKEDLKNLVETAKEAGVLKEEDTVWDKAKKAVGSILSGNNADLASQTPAGEASVEDILPGSDGWVNPAETGNKGEETVDRSGNVNDSNSSSTPTPPPVEEEKKEEEENKPEAKAKTESKYKLRSIMDAYNEGALDKESRDYLIVDALSKFARNTGKDLSNLAAAYTGGSQNNDRESGIWEERNKAMAEKGIGAEGNQFRANDNYDLGYKSQEAALESQQLANAKERIKMIPAKNFTAAADKIRGTNPTAAGFLDLIAAASTQGVDPEEYIAMAYATDPNAKKLIDEVIKASGSVAGGLGRAVETVDNFLSPKEKPTNDVTDFFKGSK